MKFLTPEIAKMAKNRSHKSLAKPGISCGIFQDCFDKEIKHKSLYRAKPYYG